jgi:hypothetical protein
MAGVAGMLLGALVTIPVCIYKAAVKTKDNEMQSSQGQLLGSMHTLHMLDENNSDGIRSRYSANVMFNFIGLIRLHQGGFAGEKEFDRYLVETARYIKSHPKDFFEQKFHTISNAKRDQKKETIHVEDESGTGIVPENLFKPSTLMSEHLQAALDYCEKNLPDFPPDSQD